MCGDNTFSIVVDFQKEKKKLEEFTKATAECKKKVHGVQREVSSDGQLRRRRGITFRPQPWSWSSTNSQFGWKSLAATKSRSQVVLFASQNLPRPFPTRAKLIPKTVSWTVKNTYSISSSASKKKSSPTFRHEKVSPILVESLVG